MDSPVASALYKVIKSIFDVSPISSQPRSITLNLTENDRIKSIVNTIIDNTYRGGNLTLFPVEIFFISENIDVPRTEYSLPDGFHYGESYTIEDVMSGENIDSLATTLPLFVITPQNRTPYSELIIHITKKGLPHAPLFTIENTPLEEINNFLIDSASFGVIPSKKVFEYTLNKNTATFFTRLDKHKISIRKATKDDITQLVTLESQCWNSALQMPKDILSLRLDNFPDGQLVIEKNSSVIGVIYTQRIKNKDELDDISCLDSHGLHHDDGKIAQLLALNILPEEQHHAYGDLLLEFLLQNSIFMKGIEHVIGVTRCKDYTKHQDISMPEYIHRKNSHGRSLDTVLRFHQLHGGKIERLVNGYRPGDQINQGSGVLVSYDIYNRRRDELSECPIWENPISTESSKSFINKALKEISEHYDNGLTNDIHTPLFELGIDSADLLDLSETLNSRFSIQIRPSFFFQYNTSDKIFAYIQENSPLISSSETRGDTSKTDIPLSDTTSSRDIAIIGISCRLPNGINHYDELWQTLKNGESAITSLPNNRWEWPANISPKTTHRGIDKGGFIDDIEKFDAQLFRISPREAELMDPQHRLLLEQSWSCIEDAGYKKSDLEGRSIGVFVGASGSDYQLRLIEQKEDICAHFGLSTSNAILANRLSYYFDWSGPSMLVDTACSSSLVALNEAVTSLRAGHCSQALVAGVNVMCHPATSIAYYKAGMLSKDGYCKTFDASANGYVRSEGVIAVLLKPLHQAIHDGDDIRGVIKGCSTNHGGQAAGLTVPNPIQHTELIEKAISDAHISVDQMDYLEAHGTGTSLGDPVEIEGLKTLFSKRKNPNHCVVGSIKSNLGHLEACAGLAGLLKVLLCFEHQRVPKNIHYHSLNPNIDLESSGLKISNTEHDFSKQSTPLTAGISSFGSGGTNAHVIVESFNRTINETSDTGPSVIILSAKTDNQLRTMAQSLIRFVEYNKFSINQIHQLAYTLQTRRESFEKRIGFIFANAEEIISGLRSYVETGTIRYDTSSNQSQSSLSKALDDWISGGTVNWHQYYTVAPQHMRAPTYVFNSKPYWKPLPKFNAVPMVDCSTNNLATQKNPNCTDSMAPKSEKSTMTLIEESVYKKPDYVITANKPRGISLKSIIPTDKQPNREIGINIDSTDKDPISLATEMRITTITTRSDITKALTKSLSSLLFLDDSDIDINEQFTYMGLDSISGVEWLRNVNRDLDLTLTATAIYSYPTITQLAEHIVNKVDNHPQECKDSEPQRNITIEVRESEKTNPEQTNDLDGDSGHIKDVIESALAEVLFLPVEEIDSDEPFSYLGLDSISGVEFVRLINKSLSTNLSATLIYSYPSISQLVHHIASDHYLKNTHANSSFCITPKDTNTHEETSSNASSSKSKRSTAFPLNYEIPTNNIENIDHRPRSSKIAIIGMAGQYPGASHLSQYWENLIQGINSVTEIPNTRWNKFDYYDARPFQKGKTNSKWLGALSDIECFDADFFGITSEEAIQMDPQQRLFLQEAYHSIENSGYSPESLKGKNCGVYLGVSNNEYATLLRESAYGAADRIGNNLGIAAARIAYYLDIKGPALAIDTACSSSLVAVHLACQALRNNEVNLALAGGACTYLTPELYIGMSVSGMLAPDGQCKTFDDLADGIVPGEGIGAVMLKRLEDAEADNDNILGVIIGSGINQDGKTNGITAPNGKSQTALIRDIYERFDIDSQTISYVETHGTGTKLGDPIELEALSEVFSKHNTKKQYCILGSVKTNLGHTSAASGIAGLHKTLLALKHRKIPKNIHFKKPNSHFNFPSSPFIVNTQTQDWKEQEEARRAAISSFGISGTNAHIVVEEYCYKNDEEIQSGIPAIFVCSAINEERLVANLKSLHSYLSNNRDISLHNLCYTLQTGRNPMKKRLAIVADNIDSLRNSIQSHINGEDTGSTLHYDISTTNISTIFEAHDLSTIVSQWAKNGSMNKIANLWVNGIDIDWNSLPYRNGLRKIELPGYEFSKSKFWIPNSNGVLKDALESATYNLKSSSIPKSSPPIPNDQTVSVNEATLIVETLREYINFHPNVDSSQSSVSLCNITFISQPSNRQNINVDIKEDTKHGALTFTCAQGDNKAIFKGEINSNDTNKLSSKPLHDTLARCGQKIENSPAVINDPKEITRIHRGEKELLIRCCQTDDFPIEERNESLINVLFYSISKFLKTPVDTIKRIFFSQPPPKSTWILLEEKKQGYNAYICDDRGTICIGFEGITLRDNADTDSYKEYVGSSHVNTESPVIKKIMGIISTISDLPPARLNVDTELGEYGFDSIKLNHLASQLNQEFSIAITPILFFQYPTIKTLCEYLSENHQLNVRAGTTDEKINKPSGARHYDSNNDNRDAIAVVGISVCLPGANNLNEFWQNLLNGKDCIEEIPPSRWDWRDYWGDPSKEALKTNIKWGGFAKELTYFDPLFFGISPREAEMMDVQQRALITAVWKALEDAGYAPGSLAGSQTAILVGTGGGSFGKRVPTLDTEAGSMLGMIPSIGPNRISHLLDIHGPSEPIETTCSSSLVALHRSISLLRNKECNMAIAGGVNVLATPEPFCSLSKAGMLSKDGRCKTFSQDANGYARGEGAGIVVLKRVADAERDGDNIYGLILGSAENHGGKSQSLTAPNPVAQTDLLKKAFSSADVASSSIGYIEAHGTGTVLGDPIETHALKMAFSSDGSTPETTKCGIGSVKTNIGHLELASGIAGVIKVILQLKHKTLVKSLHAETLNPLLDLEDSPLFVVQENQKWNPHSSPSGKTLPRRAGVSSFGFGGVNAHVILEEYPEKTTHITDNGAPDRCIIILSAKSRSALRVKTQQLCQEITNNKKTSLQSLAYTLQVGRDDMRYRLALIGSDLSTIQQELNKWIHNESSACQESEVLPNAVMEGSPVKPDLLSTLESEKIPKIVEAWLSGKSIHWPDLYTTQPTRTSLPSYPFEGKDYLPRLATEIQEQTAGSEEQNNHLSGYRCFAPIWDTFEPNFAVNENPSMKNMLIFGELEHLNIPNYDTNLHQIPLTKESDTTSLVRLIKQHSEKFDRIVWRVPTNPLDTLGSQTIIDSQGIGVLSGLKVIQALLASGYTQQNLRIDVITENTVSAHQDDRINPSHSCIHGLIGTLAKEQSNWDINLVDIDRKDKIPWHEILNIQADKRGRSIAVRRNEWYRKQLIPVNNWDSQCRSFTDNGVYVIIGGAGDVGVYMTEYLIREYNAQIIWLGRRPLNKQIEDKINQVNVGCICPQYLQADASDHDALLTAYQQIKILHQRINGVIHAAMVFSSDEIKDVNPDNFENILKSKVHSSVRVADVFKGEPLDFVLYFSSLITCIKNPKQSHYAAACEFKDAFAYRMSHEWQCATKIVNWGYWATQDVVQSEDYDQLLSIGIGFIEKDKGMALLETLISSPVTQLGFMRTTKPIPIENSLDKELITTPYHAIDQSQLDETNIYSDRNIISIRNALKNDNSVLNDLLVTYLYTHLNEMGLFSDDQINIFERATEIGIPKSLHQWLKESLHVIENKHFITKGNNYNFIKNSSALTTKEARNLWLEKKSIWLADPAMKARALLLEPIFKELPRILTGKIRSTDVLFPNSSMELVGNVYKFNRVADFFNEALANTIVRILKNKIGANNDYKIRILEIGAGTGGTTTSILKNLSSYHKHIGEYCYTDISRAFLSHAEKTFGPENPFLTYKIFNVDKPLYGQGIDIAQYDIVVAANVLHATENMRRTLTNAKATLKQDGVILLNEISQNSLFMHLTFGLTEGWWLYDDIELRVPGSPALSPKNWKHVLHSVGFHSIQYMTKNAHDLGQQIIVAKSDGIVRQKQEKNPKHRNKTTNKEKQPPQYNEISNPITRIITECIQRLLKIPEEEIDVDTAFSDYGVDSITGVNLVNELNNTWESELETTILFDYATVTKLSEHIEKEYPDLSQKFQRKRDNKTTEYEKRAQNTVSSSTNTNNEKIAIIGVAGRFSQSDTIDELWDHLEKSEDLTSPVSRWDLEQYVDEIGSKEICRHGSFLDEIDAFDPMFFNISGVEARSMDPQQRIFLEESWHALEDAGYAGNSVKGKECGVFVGCMGGDYRELVEKNAPAQAMWGNSPSILPARIAYHLDLKGPAVAIDTACSSSLVAIHLACQSLRTGETEMALAGGVYVQCTPRFYINANRAAMLSPSGRCHTFDDSADGFVPGEGAGVLTLKRLADAERDGDHIYGVISGSGTNQDGATNGITAPSAISQEELLRKVYDGFGVNAADIQMVEAHGTGTRLGDPIEFSALTKAFKKDTKQAHYCAVGSIKTNIGHTTHAAGVAGVIKILLSLKHRRIPASLHFEHGNKNIQFKDSPFYVNTAIKDWGVPDNAIRRAAVSSFGFSGTNAHLVIEESPNKTRETTIWPSYLFLLSAKSQPQLKQQAIKLRTYIESNNGLSTDTISFTLLTGREHFEHRFSCVAQTLTDLMIHLNDFIEGVKSDYNTSSPPSDIQPDAFSDPLDGNHIQNDEYFIDELHRRSVAYCLGHKRIESTLTLPKVWNKVSLPTYPFAKDHYWIEDDIFTPPLNTEKSETLASKSKGRRNKLSDKNISKSLDAVLEGIIEGNIESNSAINTIINMEVE
ncbi:MAG: KR domain-containing protein [Agarilytica sp.]